MVTIDIKRQRDSRNQSFGEFDRPASEIKSREVRFNFGEFVATFLKRKHNAFYQKIRHILNEIIGLLQSYVFYVRCHGWHLSSNIPSGGSVSFGTVATPGLFCRHFIEGWVGLIVRQMSQQTGRINITYMDIGDGRFIQVLRVQIMFLNPRYFRIRQKITQQEVGLIDAEKWTRDNGDQPEEPNGSGVRPDQSGHVFHARGLNEAGQLLSYNHGSCRL